MREALLFLLLGTGLATDLAHAQTSITAGDINALPGSNVVVPIRINSDEQVSALQFTLEFDPETLTVAASPPLRGDALVDHAVGVHSEEGSVHIGDAENPPAEGENELIFPQIANGSFPGGKIAVLMVFVNRTQAGSSGEISFFTSDGSPFVLKLTDGRED